MSNWVDECIKKVIMVIIITIFVEVFIFNYQHFFSSDLNLERIRLDECGILSETIETSENDEGIRLGTGADGGCGIIFQPNVHVNNISICASGSDNVEKRITNSNKISQYRLSNSALGLSIYGGVESESQIEWEEIYEGVIYDDGNGVTYNVLNNTDYRYFYVAFSAFANSTVSIESICVNVIPKLKLMSIRMAVIFLLGTVFAFKKKISYFLSVNIRIRFVLLLSLVVGIFFGALVFVNPVSRSGNVSIDSYNDLASSLIQGKFTVYDEYAYSLDELADIYNYEEREASGLFYLFDYAYYKGHYYIYFGIVPCILLYLPYMLITGNCLLNSVAMSIFVFGLCVGIGVFLYELIDRYFEGCTRGQYAFGYFVIAFMAHIPFMISFPLVYQIAQCSGLFFLVWGLALYIKAGAEKIDRCNRYIVLGSLFIALSAGCRPQFAILGFLAIPLLKGKMLVKRKNIVKMWLSFLSPYIVIAFFLMLYNYLRFKNPFEFGAKYTLTSDNIYYLTVNIKKILVGFKYMFLERVHLSKFFPYIDNWTPDYEIDRQVNWTTGGFLLLNMLALVSIIPVGRSMRKRGEVLAIQYYLIFTSIFLGVFDVICCGCIERYKIDFGIWIGIATAIVCISLLKTFKSKLMRGIFMVGLVETVLSSSILYFYSDVITLIEINKPLFQGVSRFFAFWL